MTCMVEAPFQIGKGGEKELLSTKITARWAQSFEEKHQNVQRKQSGKLMSSPEMEE
jgi:hypothetical protein